MGAAILDNDVFHACHRYCLTIGPLRKAGSLTSLNDWSVEQTSCLTALNHWSVEERIPTRMGSCLVACGTFSGNLGVIEVHGRF